ncbi:heavy metal-binding protein HIP-like [Ruditapes philippinarum]|uniref:heavy metal-binding protein HIP-like n=1 Tax=Ruditapes philippinarum TaxID=129788 RepID=UPI00295B8C87|nr:heavy metal-binding protein HIP-like [Ruditapes philippinarum]
MAGHMIFASVLIAASMVHFSVATEEMCSKFSYEKEIIANMLKMELKVEKMEQEVKKRNEDIVTMLDTQKKEMEKFANDYKNLRDILVVVMENKTAAVNSFLEDKAVNVLDDKIAEVDDALKIMTRKVDDVLKGVVEKYQNVSTVAFSAAASKSQNKPRDHQIILFDSIQTNIGDAYNVNSGQFTAPVAGTYVFTCSLFSGVNVEFWAYIAVNKTPKALLNERGTDGRHGMASQTLIAHLNPGDVVTVNTNYGGGSINGGKYSTFSGFLLR